MSFKCKINQFGSILLNSHPLTVIPDWIAVENSCWGLIKMVSVKKLWAHDEHMLTVSMPGGYPDGDNINQGDDCAADILEEKQD